MQSDYRVKKLVTEEGGDVIAICYDVLYGETFEKYIGIPNDFDAKENASNLLQDSNYEISDEIRAELEETFGLEEFEDDQDYDGYMFYDFGDDEDDEEDFAVPTKYLKRESFNLREALNTIDINTYNKYDLLNLYESCNLSENEKRALANIVYDQEDASVIYDTLNNRYVSGEEIGMPERVKSGVIHEDIYSNDEESTMTLVANDVVKFPNVISFKATFNEGELKGHTWSFVKADANGEEFIRSIGGDPDDTPVAFLTVNGRDGGYFTSTKDFASGEYTPNPNDMGTYFDDIQPELEESVKKSLTEGFYRGCKGVTMIGHGSWSDPELEYDGYLFNYWEIENALWDAFLDETGYSDAQSDDPKVEEEFNAYVKEICVDYLNECIYSGVFTGLSIEGDMVDFPNGDYYYVGYNDGKISLDNAYNAGRAPEYSIDYDFEESIDTNLQRLYDHAIEKSPWLNGDDDDLDESVEDDLGDDELNAFYKGYTEEDKDENSAYNKLKKNVNKSKSINEDLEDVEFVMSYYMPDLLISDIAPGKYEASYRGNDSVSVIVEFDTSYGEFVYTIDGEGPYSHSSYEYIQGDIQRALDKKLWKNESKSIKESDEETPYTKEEIERDLKSITHNFTDKDGELKCGFEEEKNFGVEILRQHYRIVEVSGDDRREGTWYHISFAEPIEK